MTCSPDDVSAVTRACAWLSAVVLLVASAAASAVDVTYLQGLGDTRYERLHAEAIGRDFHVYVMLPDGYDEHPDRRYPTMYVLDGGSLYPLLVAYYRYLRLGEEVPAMIIVGISYGSDRFAGGNFRASDYTAPSEHRDYWGGAGAFQSFVRDELMPRVESTYRSRADRRIVFGHSLGGQFVLYTAQTQPQLFWGHIASNPALHRNLPFFLAAHWPASAARAESYLYVGSSSGDDPAMRVPLLEWIGHWSGRNDLPWLLNAVTVEGHSHMSLPPAAFREGLRWMFAER